MTEDEIMQLRQWMDRAEAKAQERHEEFLERMTSVEAKQDTVIDRTAETRDELDEVKAEQNDIKETLAKDEDIGEQVEENRSAIHKLERLVARWSIPVGIVIAVITSAGHDYLSKSEPLQEATEAVSQVTSTEEAAQDRTSEQTETEEE